MKAGFILILCSVLVTLNSQAHDQIVHEAITLNAASAAYVNSPAFHDFINIINSDKRFLIDATNKMRVGSFEEDDGPTNILNGGGGHRSYNHFYDPLDNAYGKGLTDVPNDRRSSTPLGKDSFAWASISNCVGVNYYGEFYTYFYQHNLNTSNIWSWPNARYYEWLGLTATNQIQRQTNLDNMFRAVGQVMHLLEDASQPQHVRNEQHLDQPIPVIGTPWLSPIEEYGKSNYTNFNYGDGSMLDWKADGFTKLEDFWDRHLYNGTSSQPLVDSEDPTKPTSTLGLAEWCNGNFLGDRHSYAEYFFQHNLDGSKNVKWYPYPSLFTSTPYLHHGAYVDSVTLPNKKQVNRYYLDKTGDGIQVSHFSTVSFFGANFPNKIIKPATSIRDDNVLSNYHNAFIPKAVKYSAGLLDYFFRGTMAVTASWSAGFSQFTNIVLNTSGQDFHGGSFFLFQETNGMRTLLQQFTLIGTLTNGGITNLVYSGLTSPTNNYIVFYQGTIGYSNSAALDPVDANIGIAVPGSNTVWHSSFEGGVNSEPTTGDYFAEGWHVDSGNVDLAENGIWGQTAYEGDFMLDLDGSDPGTISTNISTVTGQTYQLGFVYTRNPDGLTGALAYPPDPTSPSAEVLINGNPMLMLVGNITNNWSNLQWHPTNFNFTATSSTITLTFHSLDSSNIPFGILLDAINLSALSVTNLPP
jgi:hypothetical protein